MTFTQFLVFILILPIISKAAARLVALDAKLDPMPFEDETRFLYLKQSQYSDARLNRSFCKRWLRSANYSEENILRAIDGRPVDNCPRTTRAKEICGSP